MTLNVSVDLQGSFSCRFAIVTAEDGFELWFKRRHNKKMTDSKKEEGEELECELNGRKGACEKKAPIEKDLVGKESGNPPSKRAMRGK